MGKNIRYLFLLHARRQINMRPDNSQDKRGCYHVAHLRRCGTPRSCMNFQRHSFPYRSVQPQAACQRIYHHQSRPRDPDHPRNSRPDIKRIHTGSWFRRKALTDDRIDCLIQPRNPTVNERLRRISDYFCTNCLAAGYQTEGAFREERAQKPDSHHRPQHTDHPSRRFSKQKPHDNDRQDQPSCCNTHIKHF